MAHDRTDPAAADPRSTWRLIAALAVASTGGSFMQTLVIPIQNHLPGLLDASRASTAWVLTISLVAAAVTTPISGRLGDLFGKRTVALALIGLLILGSLVAALSTGLVGLLVGRALQGASMGIIAVAISILGDHPDPRRSTTGIAIVSASLGFGGALGLPLSAWVVQLGDWKFLFWASALLGVITFLGILAAVPASPGTHQRVDVLGAIGLAAGLSGILIAVSQGPVWGWASAPTLGLGFGGVAVLLAWGVFELRVAEPIVDLRLLARRRLLLVNLGSIALGFSFFVMEVAFMQMLELPADTDAGLGLTMLEGSLALVPGALAMMALAPVSARLIRGLGGHMATGIGALTIALAYAYTLVWHDAVWHLVLSSTVLCAGLALAYAAIPTLVMAEVPRSVTGSANGVNALMRSVGTSTGAAVTGMVLAATSREHAGAEVPALSGFLVVFALGLVTALACLMLVWAARRSR